MDLPHVFTTRLVAFEAYFQGIQWVVCLVAEYPALSARTAPESRIPQGVAAFCFLRWTRWSDVGIHWLLGGLSEAFFQSVATVLDLAVGDESFTF